AGRQGGSRVETDRRLRQRCLPLGRQPEHLLIVPSDRHGGPETVPRPGVGIGGRSAAARLDTALARQPAATFDLSARAASEADELQSRRPAVAGVFWYHAGTGDGGSRCPHGFAAGVRDACEPLLSSARGRDEMMRAATFALFAGVVMSAPVYAQGWGTGKGQVVFA